MGLHVLKFGGTSVGSLKRLERVADIVTTRAKTHQVVVVLSAMSGETDGLIELAHHFTKSPNSRELDVLLTVGEQKSVALFSICLSARGIKARSLLGSQVSIRTSNDHTCARIENISTKSILEFLNAGEIIVVPGFQGVTVEGEITTLGRGGSDTTAVALAAALKADVCDIYTDVEGVFTTDPNIEPKAKKLSYITYDEMLELASLGAKVLQTRSVEFAKKYKVPVHVRSTFKDVEGTWVLEESKLMESLVVSGITYTKNEAKIVVEDMPDRVGIAADLFTRIGEAGVMVDVIVQNVSKDGTTDISFTVPRSDMKRAIDVVNQSKDILKHGRVVGDDRISKVSVIGNGMRSHAGVAAKMFQVLAREGINLQMISTSEIKISCVVDEKYTELAVRVLHDCFGLDKIDAREVNDFK
ncbi:MAG: aspartate kinase [Bacteriovoracaceae bacterium]|nr:aspartate kinase [Bacteriovoracaceae bacterium]